MLTLRRFKGTIATMVVVLFTCVVVVSTVDAVRPKSGSNEFVAWYIYVYDVGLTSDMKTKSSHYYKVRRRGDKNVSGAWEFAHKIRRGWVLGSGGVVPGTDVGTDGHIFLTARKTTQSKRDSRGVSYADIPAGMFYVEAYTRISLQVSGSTVAQAKVTDYHQFSIDEEEP